MEVEGDGIGALWTCVSVWGDIRIAESLISACERRLLTSWSKPCWDKSLRPHQGVKKILIDPGRPLRIGPLGLSLGPCLWKGYTAQHCHHPLT